MPTNKKPMQRSMNNQMRRSMTEKEKKIFNVCKKICIVLVLFMIFLIFVSVIISDGDDSDNKNSAGSGNNASVKWSEMTLGDKKDLAETSCQDYVINNNLVDMNKIDVFSLRYSWNSWTAPYSNNWSTVSKEVSEGNKVGTTKEGNLPVYSYNWNGSYKNDDGKYKVEFDCFFSVDENNNNDVHILWISLEGLDLVGSKEYYYSLTQ